MQQDVMKNLQPVKIQNNKLNPFPIDVHVHLHNIMRS